MTYNELILKSTASSLMLGAAGYGTAALTSWIAPTAGFINGVSFGLILNITGKYLSLSNETDERKKPYKVRLLEMIVGVVTLVASATLSFLTCLSLKIRISYTACLLFPIPTMVLFAATFLSLNFVYNAACVSRNIFLKLSS